VPDPVWSPRWSRSGGATFQAFHDTVVSYTPAGSQAGINDVTTRAVDFAASDAPMTSAQASACNRCYQIPWSLSSRWRASVGSGLSVSFPAGESVDSDSAATSVLEATDGAIAYVGTPYLVANGLPAAGIENAAGRFEFPNLTEIETAAKTIRRVPANDAVQIVDPPSSARIAYPISTFTYAIVPADAAQKSALSQWISYALGLGQQLGPRLGFAALPPVVLRASDATLHAFSSS
jgi:ABC-type phosphate transport system substrate-binding protein